VSYVEEGLVSSLQDQVSRVTTLLGSISSDGIGVDAQFLLARVRIFDIHQCVKASRSAVFEATNNAPAHLL
jgi:hypothetical protein